MATARIHMLSPWQKDRPSEIGLGARGPSGPVRTSAAKTTQEHPLGNCEQPKWFRLDFARKEWHSLRFSWHFSAAG
jgi:hypothetical protein